MPDIAATGLQMPHSAARPAGTPRGRPHRRSAAFRHPTAVPLQCRTDLLRPPPEPDPLSLVETKGPDIGPGIHRASVLIAATRTEAITVCTRGAQTHEDGIRAINICAIKRSLEGEGNGHTIEGLRAVSPPEERLTEPYRHDQPHGVCTRLIPIATHQFNGKRQTELSPAGPGAVLLMLSADLHAS